MYDCQQNKNRNKISMLEIRIGDDKITQVQKVKYLEIFLTQYRKYDPEIRRRILILKDVW